MVRKLALAALYPLRLYAFYTERDELLRACGEAAPRPPLLLGLQLPGLSATAHGVVIEPIRLPPSVVGS